MADGNLTFDTKIDTDGFSKGVNTLKGNFNNLKTTVKGTGRAVDEAFSGKTSSKVIDLNGKIKQTEGQIKSLRAEMEKVANTPFTSKEASNLAGQIEKAEQQLISFLNQREQMETSMAKGIADLGLPEHGPEAMQGLYEANTEWQKLTSKIMQAESTLTQYEGKLHDVSQADAKVSTTGTEEYAKKEQKLQELTNRLDVYKAKLEETSQAEQKKASSANRASKSTDRLSSSMKKTTKTAIPLTKSILKLSSMFKLMLMRMAIRTTINAVKEGFENLAQVSPELNRNLSLLKSSLTQLKNSLATAFAPILNIVTPILNSFIQTITRAANAVAQFFAILGGQSTYKKAIEVQEDYVEGLKDTGKQAKKTAKDVRKSLTSIDDVNIISDGSSEAGAGGGGAGELTPDQMFDEVAVSAKFAEMIDSFKKKIGEIADVIKKSFTEGFESGLGEVNFDKIREHATGIKESLKGIFTDPDVKNAMTTWVKNVSYALGEVTGSFASIGSTIAELVLGSIDGYLDRNADFIREKLVSIFDIRGQSALILSNFMATLADIFSVFRSEEAKGIGSDLIAIFTNSFLELLELSAKFGKDLIEAMTKPITDNKDEIKEALNNLLSIVGDWTEDVKEFINDMFKSVQEAYDEHIAPALKNISDGFNKVFKSILDSYNEYLAPTLKNISDKMGELMDGPMGDMIKKVTELVSKVVGGISEIWNRTLAPFIAWVTRTFAPFFAVALENVTDVVYGLLGSVYSVIGSIIGIFSGLVDYIFGSFTGNWSRAWNGVRTIFKSVLDSLVGIAKTPINLIINLINGMLRGLQSGLNAAVKSLNKISVKIPKWVPIYGGSNFGINLKSVSLPKIPRLATGTVVPANYGEFAAILGDNKRETEVVSPLSTMKQAMKEALKESGSNNGGTTILKVYLEGKQVYQEVVKQNNQNTRRTGVNALVDA